MEAFNMEDKSGKDLNNEKQKGTTEYNAATLDNIGRFYTLLQTFIDYLKSDEWIYDGELLKYRLKALDIIAKKRVNVKLLVEAAEEAFQDDYEWDYDCYYMNETTPGYPHVSSELLTPEEYDLVWGAVVHDNINKTKDK